MHAVRTHRRRLSQVDTMARQLRQKNSASDLVAVTTGGIGHADGWLRRDVEMLTTSGRRNRLWHVKGCLGGGEQDEKARRCVGLCGAGDDQADDPQTKFTRHCNCMEIRSSAQIELSPAEDNQLKLEALKVMRLLGVAEESLPGWASEAERAACVVQRHWRSKRRRNFHKDVSQFLQTGGPALEPSAWGGWQWTPPQGGSGQPSSGAKAQEEAPGVAMRGTGAPYTQQIATGASGAGKNESIEAGARAEKDKLLPGAARSPTRAVGGQKARPKQPRPTMAARGAGPRPARGDLRQHKPVKPRSFLDDGAGEVAGLPGSPLGSPRHHTPSGPRERLQDETMPYLGPGRGNARPNKAPQGLKGEAATVAPGISEESRQDGTRAAQGESRLEGSRSAVEPFPVEAPRPREPAPAFGDIAQPSVAELTKAQDLVLGMHCELERWEAAQGRAARGHGTGTEGAFSVADFSRWTVVSKLRYIAPSGDATQGRKELKIPDLGYAASQVAKLLRQDLGASVELFSAFESGAYSSDGGSVSGSIVQEVKQWLGDMLQHLHGMLRDRGVAESEIKSLPPPSAPPRLVRRGTTASEETLSARASNARGQLTRRATFSLSPVATEGSVGEIGLGSSLAAPVDAVAVAAASGDGRDGGGRLAATECAAVAVVSNDRDGPVEAVVILREDRCDEGGSSDMRGPDALSEDRSSRRYLDLEGASAPHSSPQEALSCAAERPEIDTNVVAVEHSSLMGCGMAAGAAIGASSKPPHQDTSSAAAAAAAGPAKVCSGLGQQQVQQGHDDTVPLVRWECSSPDIVSIAPRRPGTALPLRTRSADVSALCIRTSQDSSTRRGQQGQSRSVIPRRSRSTTPTLLPSSALRKSYPWPSDSRSTPQQRPRTACSLDHRDSMMASTSQQQASRRGRARASSAGHAHSFQQYPAAAAAIPCVESSQVFCPPAQQQQQKKQQQHKRGSRARHAPARPAMSSAGRHHQDSAAFLTRRTSSPYPLLSAASAASYCFRLSYGRTAEVMEAFSATSLKLVSRKMPAEE